MKKLFVIATALFGTLLLFFLIYNFLFANNAFQGKVPNVAVISNTETDTAKQTKSAPAKKIAPLTDTESIDPFFDANDRAVLYLVPDESALKETVLASGQSKTLANFAFVPRGIVWSPDGKKALVEKSDTEWALFSRENATGSGGEASVVPLKPGIESPAWTSLGDRIVYKYFDAGTKKRTLNIANPDGSGWSVIGETPFQFLEMSPVPKSSTVAVWNRGNAFEKTSLKILPLVGGEAREIFSSNYGADYSFAPNGKDILVSDSVEKGGASISIALINDQGGGYTNLFIPSLVSKTAWSKNSRFVYYALPGSIPEGSVLPNDYFRKPILTADTFWKVDVQTGEKSRIVDTNDIDQSYDAENLVLDADETMLFFHNRRDGKIYRINL